MRGRVDEQPPLFHMFDVDARIRADHPLRDIKRRVDHILDGMSAKFATAYSGTGRPSVPPERLLKALLLMALYSVRSERQLCEAIDVNLLYRWFLDLSPSEEAFDPTTFSHNRKRLDDHELTRAFFDAVVQEALTAGLCSDHFSVDGTLIESFASAKSFQPKDRKPDDGSDTNGFKPSNPDVDFHGQKRTNETHQSRTDPEAKLYRKGPGKEAKLSHMGHTLTENRHGLIVNVAVTEANGMAERQATLDMLDELKVTHQKKPKTLGADKGYDAGEFFRELETREIEPHVPLVKAASGPEQTPHQNRKAAMEARLRMQSRMEAEGYRLSQKCRKKIEEGFGWLKTIAGLDKSRVVGRWKLRQLFELGAACYNLVRMAKLKPA
jgi:transposase